MGSYVYCTYGVGVEAELMRSPPLVGLGGGGVAAEPGVLSPGSRGCLLRFIFFSWAADRTRQREHEERQRLSV